MDIPDELEMEAMGVVLVAEVNELVIKLDPTNDAVSLVDCLRSVGWRVPREPRPRDFVFGIWNVVSI